MDYVDNIDMNVLFLPSDASVFVSFEVIDNLDADGDRSFVLEIALPQDPPPNLQPPFIPQANILITDNDGK